MTNDLKGEKLIDALKKKFDLKTDSQVAHLLGIDPPALAQWRSQQFNLTPLKFANLTNKIRAAARLETHRKLIIPIVEFVPVECVPARTKSMKFNIFAPNTGKTYYAGIKSALEGAKGLYVFYDGRGRALYVGQTHRQTLWKEMNLAFNRARSAQNIMLVHHPTSNVQFTPASEQLRQPIPTNCKLYELAAYFSAYGVADEMINELEALLVRAFPNDLLNKRMEKLGKTKKRAKKREG